MSWGPKGQLVVCSQAMLRARASCLSEVTLRTLGAGRDLYLRLSVQWVSAGPLSVYPGQRSLRLAPPAAPGLSSQVSSQEPWKSPWKSCLVFHACGTFGRSCLFPPVSGHAQPRWWGVHSDQDGPGSLQASLAAPGAERGLVEPVLTP